VKTTQKVWLNKFTQFGGSSKVYRVQSFEGSNLLETGLFKNVCVHYIYARYGSYDLTKTGVLHCGYFCLAWCWLLLIHTSVSLQLLTAKACLVTGWRVL
jgi:hypothetical protein